MCNLPTLIIINSASKTNKINYHNLCETYIVDDNATHYLLVSNYLK